MKWRQWLLLPLMLAFAVVLGYSVLLLSSQQQGLGNAVAVQLDKSGVTNPVTAVLLNFRGYDTLLEMVVMLTALLGVWSLGVPPAIRVEAKSGLVLDTLTRMLVPLFILVAAYLLWAGADAPGGAFQAGAIVGAAGVLLLLTDSRLNQRLAQRPLRLAVTAGVLTFIAIAAWTLLSGRQLLDYPVAQAGTLIFILEAVATLSIGAILAALWLGKDPGNEESE